MSTLYLLCPHCGASKSSISTGLDLPPEQAAQLADHTCIQCGNSTTLDVERAPNISALQLLAYDLAYRALACQEVTHDTKAAAKTAVRTRNPAQLIDVARQHLADCYQRQISTPYTLIARRALGTAE